MKTKQGPRSIFHIGGGGRHISDSILGGYKTLFLTNTLKNKLAIVRITLTSFPTNNLKLRLGPRKYSKCMKTWYLASTSGYCLQELKHNSEMGYYVSIFEIFSF